MALAMRRRAARASFSPSEIARTGAGAIDLPQCRA